MVEYIEINGQKYPVRIGYYVMKNVKAETGMSLSEALRHARENEDLTVHETILYYALKMGAFAEKVDMPFEKSDMELVLDMCFYDYMTLYNSDKFFPREKIEKLEEEANKPAGKPQTKTGIKKVNPKKPSQKKT